MSVTRRVTTTDRLRLAVREYGDPAAPTVVCVHGYPDNSSVWDGVAAELAERYHVVTYDVRGAGRSQAPADRSGYRLDQLAADLVSVADAVSPDRPVHLLAHDWGSVQTWHAVTEERLAHRFASFTSVSGPCLDHAARWFRSRLRPSPRRLRELLTQTAFSGYLLYLHLPVLPELGWLTGVGGTALRRMERVGEAATPPGARRPRRPMRDLLNGLNLYRENMRGRFRRPGRRTTAVPVQVLAPTADAFVSASLQAGAAPFVADLRVRRIAGGHWVPSSRPDVVARCARELIEETENAGREPAAPAVRADGAARLDRQLAVVTGAGSGIGRALAVELAARGATVVCADINGEAAARTADLASRVGPAAAHHRVDVTDGPAVRSFADRVRAEHGVPDIVVNNAGIGVAGPFLDTGIEDWQRVLDVNLWGVIHGSRAFAPMMVEHGEGGRIVNTASVAAYLPLRGYPAYATTKSAVLMLSRCLRAELADAGIRVMAVCPGPIDTPIIGAARLVGLDAQSERVQRGRLSRLYRLRGNTPEKAARQIADAIERAPALLPVTPEAHVALALSRVAPWTLEVLARLGGTGGAPARR